MPRLLYRYLSAELLRVLTLTTIVVVAVISFGVTIKPLSDGLLSADQILKYIALATVPMLQFALPFAAGFAATIVLHRMTTENEVLAAAASGMSYRRFLHPVVAIGVTLTVIMILLTQIIVPRFWTVLRAIATTDVTQIMVSTLSRGETFNLESMQISAEQVWHDEAPTDSPADQQIILNKVVAAELGEDGQITAIGSAGQAVIDIYQRDHQTLFQIVLVDCVTHRGGEFYKGEELRLKRPIIVDNQADQNTSAMTRKQLSEMKADPERFGDVRRAKETLAQTLAEEDLWQQLAVQANQTGSVRLTDGLNAYIVSADSFTRPRFLSAVKEPMEIVRTSERGGSDETLYRARSISLDYVRGGHFAAASFTLKLRQVEIIDSLDATVSTKDELLIEDVVFVGAKPRPWNELSLTELQEVAATSNADAVAGSLDKLVREQHELAWKIESQLHKRAALSATPIILILLGAVLAMWWRNAMPLIIYLASFLPAVANLMVISGGKQMIRDGQINGGALLMWSGNAVLLLAVGFAYSRLARH